MSPQSLALKIKKGTCKVFATLAARPLFFSLLLIFLLGLSLVPQSVNAQQYSIVDVGSLGGTSTYGSGLNDAGQVTGQSTPANSGTFQAFLYSNGTMAALGPLGASNNYGSSGAAINASGQITGTTSVVDSHQYLSPHAFLYSNGSMYDLGTLGGNASFGGDINSAGVIAGSSTFSINSAATHAFIYKDGAMQDLGTLAGGFSSAGYGINSLGQVTGESEISSGINHAFIFGSGLMQDIGTLGGAQSRGSSINDLGQVTGYSNISNSTSVHAFIYSQGVMMDIGTLGGSSSLGKSINSVGQITGTSVTKNGVDHAFLYSGNAMVDLNSIIDSSSPLGMYVTLTAGIAINNDGLVLANGIDSRTGNSAHTYLLSPVPLPAAIWLLVSGLGGLSLVKRKYLH